MAPRNPYNPVNGHSCASAVAAINFIWITHFSYISLIGSLCAGYYSFSLKCLYDSNATYRLMCCMVICWCQSYQRYKHPRAELMTRPFELRQYVYHADKIACTWNPIDWSKWEKKHTQKMFNLSLHCALNKMRMNWTEITSRLFDERWFASRHSQCFYWFARKVLAFLCVRLASICASIHHHYCDEKTKMNGIIRDDTTKKTVNMGWEQYLLLMMENVLIVSSQWMPALRRFEPRGKVTTFCWWCSPKGHYSWSNLDFGMKLYILIVFVDYEIGIWIFHLLKISTYLCAI